MSLSSRITRAVALVAAIGVVAVACGGSETEAEAPDTTAAAEATTSAVPATTAAPEGAETTASSGGDSVVDVGDSISVHYVGTLDDGEQFDSSRDRGTPLSFVVGSGQMISGFDAAVQGMELGEIKTVTLEPSEAYGERDDELFIEISLDQVPEGTEVGDSLVTAQGQQVTVSAIDGDVVTIDANHSLAGQRLTFEIEIVSIG